MSLLIDQSEVKDAGEYLVRVSGQDQSIESSTGVTVLYERPTFTKPLNDIKVRPQIFFFRLYQFARYRSTSMFMRKL